MKYTMSSLILMAVFISFLGWILENIWLSLTKGYVDNRNMYLPFLLGYGLLMTAFYLIIGVPAEFLMFIGCKCRKCKILRYVLYLLTAMLIVSIGEIILGHLVEKICGFEYWNYERLPMHFTKYTSLPTSLGFASIILIFMDNIFTPAMKFISELPDIFENTLAYPLGIILVLDYLISFGKMYHTGKENTLWKINVHSPKRCRKWHLQL